MGKKWEAAIGEISGTLEDGDTLLTQTKNDSQRKRIKRQEDEDEAEHKSRMARLGKETATSERAVEKTEETGTGFKVTGGLDMGHINYQELMQRQIADREVLRKEAAESAAHNQALSEDLRERLHAQEMLVMTTGLQGQIEELKRIAVGAAAQGNFMEQYTTAKTMAKELGFLEGKTSGSTNDFNTEIELRKLEFENGREMRKMAREDKRADREFQRQLNKDVDDREDKKTDRETQRMTAAAAVQAEREKRNMFAAPFETVGMALAKGLMDSNGGVSADAGDQSQHKQKRSGKRLEVNQGESGVTNCPECGEPVAIAPTARSAVCSSCDAVFPIDRVPLKAEGGIHGA